MTCFISDPGGYPDSMTMLGQRWQMVVLLVNSWRWVYYVGPTLGQHQRVLEENWMAMSCWPNVGPALTFCLDKKFYFVGLPTLEQCWANVNIC